MEEGCCWQLQFSGNLARVSLFPGPEEIKAIRVALVDTHAQLAFGPTVQPCKSQVVAATDHLRQQAWKSPDDEHALFNVVLSQLAAIALVRVVNLAPFHSFSRVVVYVSVWISLVNQYLCSCIVLTCVQQRKCHILIIHSIDADVVVAIVGGHCAPISAAVVAVAAGDAYADVVARVLQREATATAAATAATAASAAAATPT